MLLNLLPPLFLFLFLLVKQWRSRSHISRREANLPSPAGYSSEVEINHACAKGCEGNQVR